MSFSENKISSTIIYSGKVVNLSVDDVLLTDGSAAKREIVHHSGGAAVLLVREEKVLLVKQFRYAYGKEIYEIPAGKLEKGEAPLLAAKRELEEETGFSAELVPAITLYPTPGYTDEIIHIYFAENSVYTGAHPDNGEFISCEFISLENVVNMIACGEICDAKTIVAVYSYIINRKS